MQADIKRTLGISNSPGALAHKLATHDLVVTTRKVVKSPLPVAQIIVSGTVYEWDDDSGGWKPVDE